MRRTTSPPRTFNSRVIIRARASRARVQQGTKPRGHAAVKNPLRTRSKEVHTVLYIQKMNSNLVPLSHPADESYRGATMHYILAHGRHFLTGS